MQAYSTIHLTKTSIHTNIHTNILTYIYTYLHIYIHIHILHYSLYIYLPTYIHAYGGWIWNSGWWPGEHKNSIFAVSGSRWWIYILLYNTSRTVYRRVCETTLVTHTYMHTCVECKYDTVMLHLTHWWRYIFIYIHTHTTVQRNIPHTYKHTLYTHF